MPVTTRVADSVSFMDGQAGHQPRLSGSGERRVADGAKAGLESVVGGALSWAATAVGGPLAGLGVSAAVSAVQRALSSTRRDARAVSVYQLAGAEIEDRIAAGERVRPDGFFDEDEGRSAGEEVWESVLSKCRQEASERKLPYMAHLLAGIAFDQTVDSDTAHQVITAAEALTYRQLCIMRLAETKHAYALRSDDYRGQGQFSGDLYPVLHECVDLYQRGFVNFGGEVVFGLSDVKPGAMVLQGLGNVVHKLMGLSDIPDEDVARVALPMRPE